MPKMPSKKIAITGTIGSGKSTVSKMISEKYPFLSSDSIVSDLYLDEEFRLKVNRLLYNINSSDMDKKTLANDIFNKDDLKDKLENLIHPLVKDEIIDFMSKNEGLVFVEVPLLFEASFDDIFDVIITVVSDEDNIIERLVKYRDFSEEEALSRIKHQFSIELKVSKSDYVIYNNSSLDDLRIDVNKVLEMIESSD